MIFIRGKYKNHIYNNDFQEKFENGGLAQHVDIPRLEKGLQGGAFWSAFYVCPTGENTTDFSTERYSSSELSFNSFRDCTKFISRQSHIRAA
jgi:membrane dipeptidase